MVQQQMGKPIKSQNMFESTEENKENENVPSNPIMESMKVDDDQNVGGLGGLLRQSTLKQNAQNVPNINNNVDNANNLNRSNTTFNPMMKTQIGGKINAKCNV